MLPRNITLTEGMDVPRMVALLNEWQRDARKALEDLQGVWAPPLEPTPIQASNHQAKPWTAVMVDGAKAPLTVSLPPSDVNRGVMVAVVNTGSSTNTITVAPSGRGDTINGSSSHSIAEAYGHRFFYSTGDGWRTLGPRVSDAGTAIAPGSDKELVWQWNKTDVSQFEGSAAFADGSGAATLSVNTSVTGRGPILEMAGTAGTAACVVWLASDAISFPGTDRNLLYQATVFNPGTGSGRYSGLCVLGDDSGASFYGLNQFWGRSSEWASRIEAGTRSTSGNTGQGINASAFAEVRTFGRKEDSAAPEIISLTHCYGVQTAAGGRATGDATANPSLNAFGSTKTALAAGWNSLPCDRWGLAIQSSGGTALDHTLQLLDLKVYRLG